MKELFEDLINKNYHISYSIDTNSFDLSLYSTTVGRPDHLICRYNSEQKNITVSYHIGKEIRKLNKEEQGKHYKLFFDEIKEILHDRKTN